MHTPMGDPVKGLAYRRSRTTLSLSPVKASAFSHHFFPLNWRGFATATTNPPAVRAQQKPSRKEEPMSDPIVIDNIDLDLTSVDLSRPLLPKQTLKCRTGEVKVLEEDGKRRLVVPLTLEEFGKDTRGNVVNVGFQVTDSILLTPTGGLTQAMINERVARFVAACDKTDRAGSNSFRPADYVGKEVLVTFDVRVDKQDSTKTYQDCKRYAAVK